MLEYHVFTDMNEKYQSAFVFVVDREESRISIMDMYTITIQHRAGEIKMRMNMNQLHQMILNTPGGNIHTDDSKTLFEIFGDLIPIEIRLKQKEQDIEQQRSINEVDLLIRAAEAAESAHHSPIDEYGTITIPNDIHKP